MDNTQRITALSRKLRLTCNGLVYCLPAACALVWFFFNRLYAYAPMIPLPVHVDHYLPGLTRFLAFLAELIPMAAVIYGLRKLGRLFSLYENGVIFTEQNVRCFRSLGRTLIVWAACHVVRTTLLSVIITIDNPPGKRIIALMLDSGDFAALFVGVVC